MKSEYITSPQPNNCTAILYARSVCAIGIASLRRSEGATQGILTIVTSAGTYDLPLTNALFPVIDFGPTQFGNSNVGQYPIPESSALITEH